MSRYQRRQPDDIYNQILCKFIINLPRNEIKPDRIWYHYQKAFFYYIDHEKSKHNKDDLNQQKKNFYDKMNKIAPSLFRFQTQKLIDWQTYFYKNIPVYGAILLNEKKTKAVVCLVNNVKKIKYGFPKGKMDEGETGAMCARREVWEEIGYDVNNKINPNEFIKVEDESKIVVFYIVKNIKEETTVFKTQVATEVKGVEWISIDSNQQNLTKVTRNAMSQLILYLTREKKVTKSFFESFLQSFKVELAKDIEPPAENPFINFKFDKEKMLAIFK